MTSILLPVVKHIFNPIILLSRTPLLFRSSSYKSSLSLDKLYPGSPQKLTTPSFIPQKDEKFSGYIPMNRLDITYSCSSGPGGQNVNKVNTKVDLRFKVTEADWLDASIRDKLTKIHRNAITNEGFLIVRSDLTRSQHLNLADCMRKLRDLIRKAAEPPPEMKPETTEMLRRRIEKAARVRLYEKRESSLKRAARQPPTMNDL